MYINRFISSFKTLHFSFNKLFSVSTLIYLIFVYLNSVNVKSYNSFIFSYSCYLCANYIYNPSNFVNSL